MNIKVLGTGCAKCNALEKAVKEVVSEMNIDAVVEDIKDINKIIDYQILLTPGLIINEKVISMGTVPNKQQLMKYFNDAMQKEKKDRNTT
jgi:small redox-active disulfide protein 2